MKRGKISMKLKREYLKKKLTSSKKWALRALMLIYSRQTDDEKRSDSTRHHNKVGFNGCHAEIMSSFAKQYQARGTLSDRQMATLFKIIHKYWKQVLECCDEKKLYGCMLKDGVLDSIPDGKAYAIATII